MSSPSPRCPRPVRAQPCKSGVPALPIQAAAPPGCLRGTAQLREGGRKLELEGLPRCVGLPVTPAALPPPCSTPIAGREATGWRMKEAPSGQRDISFCQAPGQEPRVPGPQATPGGSASHAGRLSLQG